MDASQLTIIADFCQAAVMPICMVAYIPQWATMIRNKSSKDISLQAELTWAIGSLFASFYALVQVLAHGTGYALLCSTLLNLSCLIITICFMLYYRWQPKAEAKVVHSEIDNNLISDSETELCILNQTNNYDHSAHSRVFHAQDVLVHRNLNL